MGEAIDLEVEGLDVIWSNELSASLGECTNVDREEGDSAFEEIEPC